MESASPEHPAEQPPGYISSFIGVVIAMLTITLPLYAISNFDTVEADVPQQPSPLFMRAQE